MSDGDPPNMAQYITIEDIYVAYRKAKVDMFFERDHATALSFAQYEKNLTQNLRALHERLTDPDQNWMFDPSFVGTYTYILKSIDREESRRKSTLIHSDPDEAWRTSIESDSEKPTAKFRVVGRHPVDFHIVSALWIQKVGHRYDAVLGPYAYASRVRRVPSDIERSLGGPCTTSLGNFRHYSFGFRQWRANGLKAMSKALEEGKPIIGVTADLRSFYHEVSPDYLLSEIFRSQYGVSVGLNGYEFTRNFVLAIHTWANHVPEHREFRNRGLPVGLSAPRLIANVILHAFDRAIIEEMSPIYYGRYVDDVFLVLENQKGLHTDRDVWQFISERSREIVSLETEDGKPAYQVNLNYDEHSRLRFIGNKQKVFFLEGSTGKSLLRSIMQTVTKRSSDYRLLPDLPGDEEELVADFLNAGQDAAEEVDNLRKADGMTVQRLAFSLRLRNFEWVRHDLLPHQWKPYREHFYQLVLDHVITVPGVFTYASYVSRMFSLIIACGDWEYAVRMISRLDTVFAMIAETTIADPAKLSMSRYSLLGACYESMMKSLGSVAPSHGTLSDEGIAEILKAFTKAGYAVTSVDDIKSKAASLLESDLGYDAFREHWVNGEPLNMGAKESAIQLPLSVRKLFHLADAWRFLREAKFPGPSQPRLGRLIPRTVAFPTRPFTTDEITQLDQRCLTDWELFRTWVTALRGTQFSKRPYGPFAVKKAPPPENGVVTIPNVSRIKRKIIALPALSTEEASWTASVMQMPDPDARRYFRINNLINSVIDWSKYDDINHRPTYLVLPELALPRKWFNRIAHRLWISNVSLIAGLEYQHHGGNPPNHPYVANQVRAALITNLLGYPSLVIYEQEKERAAPDEATHLDVTAHKVLKPIFPTTRPVIRHDDFHFGILICSELTNIELRASLRGKVDALVVPEWNQDLNSFSSLVESAALDIHCFVVQVNNRKYGDCRVRGPYKEEFQRDIARIKGGVLDYFVLAELDVASLRKFQSLNTAPKKPLFKPKPDGFVIDPSRQVLPDFPG